MTDLAPEALVAPDTPAVDPTILGELRAARQQTGANSEPLYLEIPGYAGKLIVRYKWTDPRTLSATAQSLSKIEEATEQLVAASADTLAAACEEVFVKVQGAQEIGVPKGIKPLSTNEHPVTFADPRLAFALGFDDPRSARDMVVRAFNNPYALMKQAGTVVEWLEDTTKKVNEAFLGE